MRSTPITILLVLTLAQAACTRPNLPPPLPSSLPSSQPTSAPVAPTAPEAYRSPLFTLCDAAHPERGFCLSDVQVRAIRAQNRLREAGLEKRVVEADRKAETAEGKATALEASSQINTVLWIIGIVGASVTAGFVGYEIGKLVK